ncbi:Deoxyribose operon repressor, DeoR family [Photobacterium marinum]|uniref:Deoxyribose operon repressor, DeoR family n=1 Tax=Photobacterium marinum TaxID=1056511 RepID=L8JD51_9GAMM|nr:DNA-binding transcriptional repressor DeoR [Photobacterium marinum]ELR65484.1 Deoxyribose operon repressor, DeoR family [Photobacterium marinum]
MSETKRDKRLKQLSELLVGREKLHLKDAADSLSVSEMTIRRDLSDSNPFISLIGGYIINKQVNTAEREYVINEQTINNVNEKIKIGSHAASLIAENQTVFFDNGTTIVHIIQAINDKVSFTGVCFSLNVFLALKSKTNCKAVLCGGGYDPRFNNFYPLGVNSEIDNIRFDLVFLSAAGVDIEHGITCYSFHELPYKMRAIKQGKNVILAADHSKFGKVKSAFVCKLSDIHQVISDTELPVEYKAYF